MKTIPTTVKDALVFEFARFEDSRGYFQEVFNQQKYPVPTAYDWRQANVSKSAKNVIRGIHVATYPKLCTCVRGRLFDVVADLRPESPTYLSWYGVWLTEDSCTQLYVPERCGHGFFAAEDNTVLMYLQGGCWTPTDDQAVRWNDPKLNISWPEPEGGDYILSEKDSLAAFLTTE